MNSEDLNSLKLAVEKIKTLSAVFEKIDQVTSLISAFTSDETKQALVQSVIDNIDDIKAVMATSENIDTIAADLIKGNYLGNRKIDIDLSLNKSTSDATVSYSKATIVLTDGTQLAMPFLSGEAVLELTSHNDIRNYIIAHTLWASVQYTECTVEEATSTTNTLIRFRDADGHSSNIERIELAVYSGTALDAKPSYFWANSTSALQTIANRVGDIIALGNDIDKIVELSQNIDELTELQNALTSLLALHTNLTELLKSSTYAQTASTKAGEASVSATSAASSAQTASDKATLASQKADIATQKANEIKAITVQSTTGAAGSQAQASYNSADGKLSFVIPQGLKGDRGEAFKVSAIGLFSVRVDYDTQPKDFSFFATDTSMIYFKNSDTSADWSAGVPFGKGDKGDTGETGDGISSLAFVSSTLGTVAGRAGATDTYRITMTSGGTFDFNVYNGNEPDVTQSYVDNLINGINNALSEKASIEAVNNALQALDDDKADKSTTLGGYGITNAYTKSETESLVSNSNKPCFSATRLNASQALSTGVWTRVQLNSKEFDLTNAYDNTTNYRFQPDVAGYYHLDWCVAFDGTKTRCITVINKNGALLKYGNNFSMSSNTDTVSSSGSCIVYLNGTTDYIDLYAYAVGSSLLIALASSPLTFLSGHFIRS